jgi:hypothetical protein
MSRKQQIWFVAIGFPAKSALAGGDAGNQAKGGLMNQGCCHFFVARALAPPAGAEGASPGLAQAAGNVARIMAAATLQRQVLAREGLASPYFLPALS